MNGSIRVSAKTVDDAITEAMIQLGVTSDRLEYEVIEKGSSGFLGIGMKQAVIEARRKPESEPEVVEEEPFAPVEEIREEKAEEIVEPVKAEVKEEAPVVEKQEERPAEEGFPAYLASKLSYIIVNKSRLHVVGCLRHTIAKPSSAFTIGNASGLRRDVYNRFFSTV